MSEVLRYIIISWGIGAGSLLLYALVKVIRDCDRDCDQLLNDGPKKERKESSDLADRLYKGHHTRLASQYATELVNAEITRRMMQSQTEAIKQFCRENSYAPVVMCKDCKYCKTGQYGLLTCYHYKRYGVAFSNVDEGDFCSYGERKEGLE